MRYLGYLIVSLLMQTIAWVVTPILPLLSKLDYGSIDNNNGFGLEPRLPNWLSWFMTPDNSLLGDNNWKAKTDGKYWSQVMWLYRNSLYGFKWTVLSATIDDQVVFKGNPKVNHRGPVYGLLRGSCGDYWQYKLVKPLLGDYCLVLNLGWLLDNVTNGKALFMLSPRIKKVQYG
jgi:hypothetical protein